MNPPCSDRVGLTGPVCNRQFVHHSPNSELDPVRSQTADFPVSSRPSFLVNLPAASLALIEFQQTPPPLQLTGRLFIIVYTHEMFLSRYKAPRWAQGSGRSVRLHPVLGSWVSHNDGLVTPEAFASQTDERDPDAFSTSFPSWMRVPATAVTPAATCYKRPTHWLKMIAPYFGASHTHLWHPANEHVKRKHKTRMMREVMHQPSSEMVKQEQTVMFGKPREFTC